MPKKIKEEERIEKIIRGLLKLPENKRCINCNSLGPQYVCTTFWTFVCTNCSGVHREFTHRVKSVSMAKFSAEEVNALQAGGNERARQIYFKAWDPHRNSFPDGSNLHRLRDFIRHVYLDRKYSGAISNEVRPVNSPSAKSNDKLSMIKAGGRDDYQQRSSFEGSSYGAREDFFEIRSFRALDQFERHSFENSTSSRKNDDRNPRHYSEERNSPQYRQDKPRSGSHSSRTPRFEIVDDRFRKDRVGSIKRYGFHRHSNEDSRARSSSPVSQKSSDGASPVAPRPLKDILGDKASSLKVGESSKANKVDGSSKVQMAGSSNNIPAEKKVEETKAVNTLRSLIDFDGPESAATSEVEQKQKTNDTPDTSVTSAKTQIVSANTNENSLEALLFGLAPDGEIPSVSTSAPSTVVPDNTSATQATATNQLQLVPMQQSLPCAVPTENSTSPAQQSNNPEASHNQSSNLELALVSGTQTNASSEQALQVASTAAPQGNTSGNEPVPNSRQELPANLFASSYSPFPTSVPSWQSRPPYGMGYGMQYHHTAMPIRPTPDSGKSRNPFDIGDDGPQLEATTFPSMSSVQGALPNTALSLGLQPQASPYAAPFPPQGPYGMMIPPG
ncbi:OLC1v1030124C1 [Oldenlandia corymbosa var. corymbosa]|nr:OLC1v1030124C1 [Oldenlandia corymbosa var. corymbosa]